MKTKTTVAWLLFSAAIVASSCKKTVDDPIDGGPDITYKTSGILSTGSYQFMGNYILDLYDAELNVGGQHDIILTVNNDMVRLQKKVPNVGYITGGEVIHSSYLAFLKEFLYTSGFDNPDTYKMTIVHNNPGKESLLYLKRLEHDPEYFTLESAEHRGYYMSAVREKSRPGHTPFLYIAFTKSGQSAWRFR